MRIGVLVGIGALIGAPAAAAPLPTSGTVSVVVADPDDQGYADAVGQALGARAFVILPDHSRYVAQVSVARVVSGVAPSPVGKARPLIGGGGLALPLPSRKTVLVDLVTTTLTVQLIARGDGRPLWRGSAVTVKPDTAPVAAALARAVVATYPTTLPSPVSVP